ncbi:MAG TPA: ribosome small subunit-dependent GTPase A [Candidatus Dormibacteraeota bacterium]|nr:ribosome small subunit-dependent GTPase A [Candidatus Dormibacteraeota bacterium]
MIIDSDTLRAALGWDSYFEDRWKHIAEPGDVAARVVADYGADYLVHDGEEARRAPAHGVDPSVGDWVALREGMVAAIAERRTVFSRRAAGVANRQQVLAANVDLTFVVAAATDVNVRRIERYLTIAWQSGAVPIVLLTKADISRQPESMRMDVESVSAGAPVIVTSGITGEGVEEVERLLQPARTGVLLGPSGAGKSTLINRIVGTDLMRTRTIHEGTGEGRHMTSHRQLVQLPSGGMIIDTPGLREAQLWEGEEALDGLFDDIAQLALRCRFPDCEHRTEPGCAIKDALREGSLDQGRLDSYRKLQRELRSIAARSDARLRQDERRKWKQIAVANKARERYLPR